MKRNFPIGAALLLVFIIVRMEGQTYPFKLFTVDEGLPQSTVYAVFQDSRGYIWTGTQGGLSRFDGLGFTTYTTADGLTNDRVLHISEDRYGHIWIGTNDGVARFDGNGYEGYSNGIGSVFSILSIESGAVLIGSAEGVAVLPHGVLDTIIFIPEISSPVYSLYGLNDGRILAGTGHGLFGITIDDGFSVSIDTLQVSGPVMCIAEDGEGRIWAGTDGEGVAVLEGDRVSRLTVEDGLGNNKIFSMLVDTSDRVWVGSYGRGANEIVGKAVVGSYLTAQGLPSNVVRSIIQDREGNIWFATYGGLAMLRHTGLNYFDTSQGFTNAIVMAIMRDRSATLWIGTYGGGITRLHGDAAIPFKTEHGLSHNVVRSMLEDSKGRIWIGTHRGVTMLDGESMRRYTVRDGLPGDVILSIAEDRGGRIWFGTFGTGLAYLAGGTFSSFTVKNGLGHNTVRTIREDALGRIWIGTDNGLTKFEDGSFTNYTAEHGLIHNTIRSLSTGRDGSLWIATDGGGVAILRDDKFSSLTVQDGLTNNVCFLIIHDWDDKVWVGTNRGLNKISFDPSGKLPADITTISMRDGLPSNEFNTGAAHLDDDGTLWFGTVAGLVKVGRDFTAGTSIPPAIQLTKVKVFEQDQVLDAPLRFSHDENYLKFEYAGLFYSSPEEVEYRYRLSGLDTDWQLSSVRSVQYTSLPPGRYTFEVTARSVRSEWNPSPAVVHFRIVPPYWSTWWFRIISLTLIVAMIGVLYTRRIRKLTRERLEREEFSRRLIDSQEQERKRIAGELHDSLGQNLLIIKNRALMGLHPPASENAPGQLEYISDIASQAIHEVREISYNLHPYQLERLGLKEAIDSATRKIASASRIRFQTSLDELNGKFSREVDLNIYRIVQECLNNIVKHSGADEVTMTVNMAGGLLEIRISDNGCGFSKRKYAALPHGDGTGLGLKSIAERVRIIDAAFDIQSEPDKGTTVTVSIPVRP